MQAIPFNSSGSQLLTVNFKGGVGSYTFRTAWNPERKVWLVDILDENDVTLIKGVTLVSGFDLFRAYPHMRARMGQMRVAGLNRTQNGLGNIGNRFENADVVLLTDEEAPQVDPDAVPVLLIGIEDVTQ